MAYDSQLPAPTFDLDTWAANYEGALLPFRLAHVATHCPPLSRQALTLAIAAAKRGRDVQLYARLHDIAARLNLKGLDAVDQRWITQQEESNKRELARLEGELRGYKNNLIRESIRMGQEDLAMHLLLTGGPLPDPANPQSLTAAGYNAAYQAFGKMRDYCTTPSHVASMTLRLVFTALLQAVAAQQMGSSPVMPLNSVLANANRLRSSGVKEEDEKLLIPIVHASLGLAHLGQASYRDAASAFLTLPTLYTTLGPVHGTDFPRAVASANDIAIYGGLCALATLSREELLTQALAGPFRAFLELEPHLRKAIGLYTTAKYQACLALLAHYYTDWSLDLFLGSLAPGGSTSSHLDRLLHRIREKSITAYFSSFSQVSLASLAATFPPPSTATSADHLSKTPAQQVSDMQDELLSMIASGQLNARLDAVNGLLVSPLVDEGRAAREAAAEVSREVERTLMLRLSRVNVAVAGLEVVGAKGIGGAVGGRGGYFGED